MLMPQILEGSLDATGARFCLVVSRFNELLTGRLTEGAMDCLTRHGARAEDVTIVRVPGAWELPWAVSRLAAAHEYDALIAIGVLIRGATPHFDVLAAEAAKGLAQASLHSGVPVSFGVLTCDTLEQAIERSGSKAGNKGWQAAQSAIEMVQLARLLRG
jgi:6,7-dimethyl-8-ribityllumazine synthase